MTGDDTSHEATVIHWAHGRARVRLLDGRELTAAKGSRVYGWLDVGDRVHVKLSPDVTTESIETPQHVGVVVLWAHGTARVRLEGGREVVCRPGSRVRGQVVPGTAVRVALSPDGTVGRITARLDEEG